MQNDIKNNKQDEVKALLRDLTSAASVSGAEENIVKVLTSRLDKYGDVTVDCLNNVYCTFGEGRHILLDAHIDEIGFVVTDITADGFLKIAPCGGVDPKMALGYEVSVWGKKELRGVISTLPPHLQSDSDGKTVPEIKDLSVDLAMSREEISKYVSLGDRVTFRRNFTPLLGDRISASCLDDRAGVAAILLCLDRLKKLPIKVTALFSSQEEVGKRGASVGAYMKNVDEAISVDVSFAFAPGCDVYACGAMVGFSPVLNREMSLALCKTAFDNNIKCQREVMNSTTGTNADVISLNESGVKTALISIPEKYMHQPVEVVDVNDIISVSDLICAYCEGLAGECNA